MVSWRDVLEYIHTKKQPSCSKSHALPATYPHMDAILHLKDYLLFFFPFQIAAVLLLKRSPTKQLYPNPSFPDFNETLREQSQPFQIFLLSCELIKATEYWIYFQFLFPFLLAMSVPSCTIYEDEHKKLIHVLPEVSYGFS